MPRVAVISCGRGNPFGHPHPDVLRRLRDAGVEVHRTDREGAIWIEVGGGRCTVRDWRRGVAGIRGSGRAPEAAGARVSAPRTAYAGAAPGHAGRHR